MFRIIEEFCEIPKNSNILKYSGAMSALVGVFLSIPTPELLATKYALANIQVFLLVVLTCILTSLFASIITYIWHKETIFLSTYNIPLQGVFSVLIGVILTYIIFNLWVYMLSLYTEIFAKFAIFLGFPGFIILSIVFLNVFFEKRKRKIILIWKIILDSITIGILLVLGAFYIQASYTKIFYIFWLYKVTPLVSLFLFIMLTVICIYRKMDLFKPHTGR